MNEGENDRRVVDGRFELEVRLGGGGMGTVWRARDLLLDRRVAVKEVRLSGADHAEYAPEGARTLRERVLREARALARVDHPNVVTIHHIVDGGDGTYPWIVMEFVDGGSLADRLDRGAMTPVETARIGRGVLAALRAAHDAGVEHRDVKPANVLLRKDGRPVLTDFGIAAVQEAPTLTATGSLIGTPDYMAPERVAGNQGGPAADLWSLAMMIYTAVEGHHPLRRGTTLATLAAVLHDDVPPPVKAGPLTPMLTSVLVRDPAARPDAETVDRMLAGVAEAHHAPEPTSYPLADPRRPAPAPIPDTEQSGQRPPHTPQATAGPWTSARQDAHKSWAPVRQDAVPVGAADTREHANGPGARSRSGRSGRSGRPTPALGALAAMVTGGLIWAVWPGSGDSGAAATPGNTRTVSPGAGHATSQDSAGPTDTTSDPAHPRTSQQTTDLLTPDGIRSAIEAIEKKTGRDTFGDFSVYPDHVSASVMVKGSRTRYDSYTYRVGSGVEKDIISGSLSGGEQPVSLKDFRWDAVPTLLRRAHEQLNVKKPTLRYLLVRQPDTIFHTPAGMAVYLSDDYQQSGYVEADTQGKVTKVVPAEG
ncbi:serine/threonine-protein kinase [Streptomyces sp. NPDC020801]|uniref:serine/threonine-protein kinase n=1 Tax=Streptomyces sp. NPDC020801 TaxID=3365093 RepID=UPI003790D5F3